MPKGTNGLDYRDAFQTEIAPIYFGSMSFMQATQPIKLNEFMIALDIALKFAQREPTRAANKA